MGYIGKLHLRNCLNLETAKVAAIADFSKKASKHARERGVKQSFTDYSQLLKQSSIDAVIISLPTHLHAPCAIEAAEEGKHVFLEKPLARNLKEGKRIVAAARRNNVKLMVGYPLRFDPEFCALKRKLESGGLGDVQTAHAHNIASGPFFHRADVGVPKPVPEWWMKKELTGGGALMDLGSHMINLTRWYFGEVCSITAYLGYRFNFDFEDHAICIIKFESGTKAIINVGWFSQEATLGVELYGTVAHTSRSQSSSNKLITAMNLLIGKTPRFFIPYEKEISHFVQCIREDEKPSPSGECGLQDLEAITQAYNNPTHL